MTTRFGTDGWRAVIADEFTFDAVREVSRAFAARLRVHQSSGRPRVVVGFDRRFASDAFARVAAEQLATEGIDVLLCRRAVPTPVVSFTVTDLAANGGLIITASHNPPRFNGVKLKTATGASAPRPFLNEVEAALRMPEQPDQPVSEGKISEIDPMDSYLDRLASLVPLGRIRHAGMTIAVDAMFGTAAGLLPRLLDGDATQTVEIQAGHNPLFPGLSGPEPIEPNLTRLRKIVADGGATIGLAFDGDGDRIGVVDEHGSYVSSQHVFALLTRYMLEARKETRRIVKSVTGTTMVDLLAHRAKVAVVETPTGFPYISAAMIDGDAAIGGEESGGFAFGFYLPERDGLLSALLLLDYTIQTGKHVGELVAQLEEEIGPWRYRRIDLPLSGEGCAAVAARLGSMEWPESIAGHKVMRVRSVDGVKLELETGGWLLLRPSGTEPVLRLYAEANEPDAVDALLAAGRELLGV